MKYKETYKIMVEVLSEAVLAEIGKRKLWEGIVADYCQYKEICFPNSAEPPEEGQNLGIRYAVEQATRNFLPRLIEIGILPPESIELLEKDPSAAESAVEGVLANEYAMLRQIRS